MTKLFKYISKRECGTGLAGFENAGLYVRGYNIGGNTRIGNA